MAVDGARIEMQIGEALLVRLYLGPVGTGADGAPRNLG